MRSGVAACADALLAHLSLPFVPVGVGVMTHLGVLSDYGLRLLLALVLTPSSTPYPTYFSGAQFIHFLLGPAVVALAWPLWQRRAEVRQRAGPILVAALVGGAAASLSAIAIGWALGLPAELLRSLAPKSDPGPFGVRQQYRDTGPLPP